MENKDQPAFPAEHLNISQHGLTKREYFAGLAMQGLAANSVPGNHHDPKNVAREAVELADELLKQLSA